MSMKMKGIYKGFKCISQIFAVEKERDEIEIGFPTDVKHVAHIGWEGSSGSAPGWMSEFKVGAELLSPRPSSFSNARPSTSFFTSSSSTDFDQGSSQRGISDTLRDIPPVTPINLPKNNKKKSSRRKKSSSSSSSPKSSRSSVLSKSSYKSTVSRLI
ncbi:CRIB domain-containing protein RIC10 [Arabidopsis thaliana]|uniref:CRIB domain-containing protein RIC10 n=4 Tax=Arabidopsis TaxID=3701 RepID=RIC10_ARATH|nr:ROP-interactive CRIB motif-containing protein 10 [Arabidopsis thaliana]NP_192399.1 ROP-interactive CRIB motif-containing protein 10 [Arabidopsis thaliana]Q9M0Y9.1 RecName: Full=CRIB domain-containing protein RIC10; AltName: Full=ROP-interactive CRIB motif-containing protein 10; AltName: Full=Target of ROP protein RIC10 [Arabidopsis thaliana]KAG7615100.1 CRIB domain [Arabidopsis thaliana x Arabidopsis arenosa]KAG7619602.1 CRIB domain [Arabidopsis suecica]AEE82439.1 ROP-interactive CRIB motif|eukprot:NP_001319870.1 ROP-interactive CRIB motif-containing protein 10 [Arabidopsis thaliana]